MDIFLVLSHHDSEIAADFEGTLLDHGFAVGPPLYLWAGQRVLPELDRRLCDARFALVLITLRFLELPLSRKEFDGLAKRRRVFSVMAGVGEGKIARRSGRLAVAALPWSENFACLIAPTD